VCKEIDRRVSLLSPNDIKKIIALYDTENAQLSVKLKNIIKQLSIEKTESTVAEFLPFFVHDTKTALQESKSQTEAFQFK
nr:hypothetical protein [Tatlockia sp.]